VAAAGTDLRRVLQLLRALAAPAADASPLSQSAKPHGPSLGLAFQRGQEIWTQIAQSSRRGVITSGRIMPTSDLILSYLLSYLIAPRSPA